MSGRLAGTLAQFNINGSVNGGNGNISCSTPVYAGSISSCNVAPLSGYFLSSLTDNGNTVTSSVSSAGVYTIGDSGFFGSGISANHQIVATFAPVPVNGSCGASNNGTFAIAPTINLCSPDTTATLTTTATGWSWTCLGTNGGSSASCAATVDNTAPTLTLSALPDGAITNNATLNIAGTVSDASGVASIKINNTDVAIINGSFSYAITLQAGNNIITTTATDTLGNSITDTRTIALDSIAPTLSVSSPSDNSITSQSLVTVTGTTSETSVVTVKNNSGAHQNASINGTDFSSTVTLSAGVNTIEIIATDLAGNVASSKRTINYDNTNPSLSVTYPAQDITTYASSLMITGTVSDAFTSTTVNLTANGLSYAPTIAQDGSFSQAIQLSTDKTYTVNVVAMDQAGNSSSIQRNIIKISPLTQPTITEALKVLQAVVGTTPLTATEKIRYDVAPLGNNGTPVGNGTIDSADVILILRRSIDIGNW